MPMASNLSHWNWLLPMTHRRDEHHLYQNCHFFGKIRSLSNTLLGFGPSGQDWAMTQSPIILIATFISCPMPPSPWFHGFIAHKRPAWMAPMGGRCCFVSGPPSATATPPDSQEDNQEYLCCALSFRPGTIPISHTTYDWEWQDTTADCKNTDMEKLMQSGYS